ncbi:MAG: DNA polymerase subunit beta [Leptolyngbyaceae cyanobacterium SM2_5_2]|nr:DNA polymerase subunit beta [Leptolyngbyaceae cyanobacterium SM2_5_2]
MSQANSPAVDEVLSKRHEIAKLCQKNQVARLALFGSATQTAFNPTTSDYDFLVEFAIETPQGAANRFFGLKHGLADLLGREVDLVELSAVKNPYFLESISPNCIRIYGD